MRIATMALLGTFPVFAACGDLSAPKTSSDHPSEMAVAVNLAGAPEVAEVRLRVTAADFDEPLVFPLTIENGVASGTAYVPAGLQRRFTLQALDANRVVRYEGSMVADVVAGQNPPLAIVLQPVGPVGEVPITGHIGSYTLELTPESPVMAPGTFLWLVATLRDPAGNVVESPTLRWEALEPAIAGVGGAGRVAAYAPGNAPIRVHYGELHDMITVVVRDPGTPQDSTPTDPDPDPEPDPDPPTDPPPQPTPDLSEPVFDPTQHTLHDFDDFNYPTISDLGNVWRLHSPSTTTFGPNDPWTGNKSVRISYSGSGQMYRGIAKYSGFRNMGSGRGPDVMIVEIGVRYTGDLYEGKEADMLGGDWRFDWKPIGDDGARFGHRSISCSSIEDDPFKLVYFFTNGNTRIAGNAPECDYHTPNTYLTGGFTSYIYKQNVNWGLGANQFDLRRNASLDGTGASITDGRWRIFKIRIERRTGGEAVGDGRYEMWTGFEHGRLVKIMEYDGAPGQRDQGFVWIGTGTDPLLTTIRLYELSSHAFGGSSQIYLGYWRAWSP